MAQTLNSQKSPHTAHSWASQRVLWVFWKKYKLINKLLCHCILCYGKRCLKVFYAVWHWLFDWKRTIYMIFSRWRFFIFWHCQEKACLDPYKIIEIFLPDPLMSQTNVICWLPLCFHYPDWLLTEFLFLCIHLSNGLGPISQRFHQFMIEIL